MNRIISLICLTTTTACFSMQHDKQQCTAQIAAFLQYHKIPSVQPKFRTLTFLNNKLHVLIENDDKARIIEILPLYDAHCDVDTHGTSVIIASQHRLDKFAKLKQQWNIHHSPSQSNCKNFSTSGEIPHLKFLKFLPPIAIRAFTAQFARLILI